MRTLVEKYNKILDDKKPQTTNKIKFISIYVKNWLFVWSNSPSIDGINFIDCMCNAGIYRDGDVGTSIEVLKLFIDSAAIHTGKSYNLFFNDVDAKRITVLKDVIKHIYVKNLPNLNIYICNKDVNIYLQNLTKDSKRFQYKQAILLFVDPYDFGTVHIPTLRGFCEKYYCELLFNLFTSDWVRNRNNEVDSRIDAVIDDPHAVIRNKQELVDYIVFNLKVGHMRLGFNYEFRTETNTELYQIIYLTPKERGLEKLKDSLWETFRGASYYRNPSKKSCPGQMSLLTPEIEEQLDRDYESHIITCNAELAKKIITSLQSKHHVSYENIAIPILEKTMLKKSHLIKHVFQPFITEGLLIKLNESVRKNNYTEDFYDIRG